MIVKTVKKKNPDFKAFCKKGPAAIRKEVTNVTISLASSGMVNSNPRSAGEAAGKKIAGDCRK